MRSTSTGNLHNSLHLHSDLEIYVHSSIYRDLAIYVSGLIYRDLAIYVMLSFRKDVSMLVSKMAVFIYEHFRWGLVSC